MIVPADGFDGAISLVDKYGVVRLPIESGTSLQKGDLVYLDSDDVKPASAQSDAGTEAANQEAFHDMFLGVSLETVAFTERATVLVATRGEFRCDCPSSTFEVGAAIGASENAAGNALLNQQVEGVATRNLSIGHCSRRVNPAGRRVWVHILGTIGPFPVAGPQTMM